MTTFVMPPFVPDPALGPLQKVFPSPDILRHVLAAASSRGRASIANLWLTEGVPFAFTDVPSLYEQVRQWLAAKLDVHAKDISLTGSARSGYSMSPRKFAAEFNGDSDLDLFVVSEPLFGRVEGAFTRFSVDFAEKRKLPKAAQLERWKENIRVSNLNLRRGFFDVKYLPNHPEYEIAQRVGNAMYLLCEKLRVTDGAPAIKRASVRVYRDWRSVEAQIETSLAALSRALESPQKV